MEPRRSDRSAGTAVGITSCGEYDPDLVYRALRQAAELAGEPDVRDKTVLLKPNILFDAPPEKALTTHPVFLEAAVRMVRDLGAGRVLVGDSPGLQKPGFTGKNSLLGPAAEKAGARWVDFTAGKTTLSCPGGKAAKQFAVTDAVLEADCIISLPKLKTHQLMFFTGAMKNLFGLIPSLMKSPYHVRFPGREEFAAMLVDLNEAVMADYAFMDGIIGMEGPGPGSGTPRQIGLVMASPNLLAMDIAASAVIGYPPLDIPVNREALSRGIWLKGISDIEYPGLDPASVKIPDFEKIPVKKAKNQLLELILPRPYRKFREALAPRPEVLHSECLRCGDCMRICSAKAISFRDVNGEKQISFNYRKCIRCYCCHEICPAKAIEIRKTRIGDFFGKK
ncbi:DUF362 domain-containing protein [Breznakiella homolactica]|uniref:DUF362 domain-containing protein n=1 Tax=Breznakiella homolactica TaxID=2798577 RepID=A0A7T7XPS4_9SPIR|nr:DUF362 domain-containing protein [Breznakiella homolactica]QQO10274.1 DUF362 domain-containing protein [Breznakiella homolactica]